MGRRRRRLKRERRLALRRGHRPGSARRDTNKLGQRRRWLSCARPLGFAWSKAYRRYRGQGYRLVHRIALRHGLQSLSEDHGGVWIESPQTRPASRNRSKSRRDGVDAPSQSRMVVDEPTALRPLPSRPSRRLFRPQRARRRSMANAESVAAPVRSAGVEALSHRGPMDKSLACKTLRRSPTGTTPGKPIRNPARLPRSVRSRSPRFIAGKAHKRKVFAVRLQRDYTPSGVPLIGAPGCTHDDLFAPRSTFVEGNKCVLYVPGAESSFPT